MKIQQQRWEAQGGWQTLAGPELSGTPQLVLAFGGRSRVTDPAIYEALRKTYPDAASHIILASTAGEILGSSVYDDTVCVTAIQFERSTVQVAKHTINNFDESETAGRELATKLPTDGLVHAMVYSDGLKVNGTALVRGILSVLPDKVAVTGGLVGDGADFKATALALDAPAEAGQLVLVGLYGESLSVGYGSVGGWDAFGAERIVTKAERNILYEVDGEPVLPLYKRYLGELAADLPASGLLFPLRLRVPNPNGEGEVEVVRTILAVDEAKQSITFAGDIPVGVSAMLMKANFERLIDGAANAATMSLTNLPHDVGLGILISCVGRKSVLKERTEEEIDAVRQVLGAQVPVCGFYSYGEISPSAPTERQCQLHNQTMTITVLRET